MIQSISTIKNMVVVYWCSLVPAKFVRWIRKYFPRYWPFVRGIHQSPMRSPHKDPCRGALVFSLVCAWTNGWANNRDAGDLRRLRSHYDVTVRVSLRGNSAGAGAIASSALAMNLLQSCTKPPILHGTYDISCYNVCRTGLRLFMEKYSIRIPWLSLNGNNA